MGLKEQVEIARARLKIACMGNALETEIPSVPKEWEDFPYTKGKWVAVDLPSSENVTACLYESSANGNEVFKLHNHKDSSEHFVILNDGGSITVTTNMGEKVYKFPEAVFIPKDTPHLIKFNSYTKILLIWK